MDAVNACVIKFVAGYQQQSLATTTTATAADNTQNELQRAEAEAEAVASTFHRALCESSGTLGT